MDRKQKYMIDGEKNIDLFTDDDVWSPYSAPQLINIIKSSGFEEYIKDRVIGDICAGTGILGIWAARYGAKKVIMSDISEDAVKISNRNAKLNKVEKKCKAIQSDRFKGLNNQIFDTIISNPPVQPWLFTGKDFFHRKNASTWNESGDDGRDVLDSLINEARNFLNKKTGMMLLTHSSRHGIEKTENNLNKYWGDEGKNWKHISKLIYEIDYFHKPYIELWKNFEKKDGMTRLYRAREVREFLKDESYKSKVKGVITEKNNKGEERLYFSYAVTITSLNKLKI